MRQNVNPQKGGGGGWVRSSAVPLCSGGAGSPCWPCCCLRRAQHSPGGEARALLVATVSPLGCFVIISQFLCFCVMQCKFLEAAVPAMKDQLVVISGELARLYPVVTESDPGVVYIMHRDCFFHQES